MNRWVAPENDWQGLVDREPEPLTIGVVLPVHERVEALVRVLSALAPQGADEVVVVDDGSEADVAGAVAELDLPTPVRVLRQERRGMGAARARNRGAAEIDTDVVAFLDADCVPGDGWVEGHRAWHGRASNLLVAGPRVDVAPDGSEEPAQPDADPAGWRATIRRRGRAGTLGDRVFRVAISANVSVLRTTFEAVGGFPAHTELWGGEDTEFAWRVWNDGAFVVPDPALGVRHLLVEGEDRSWRDEVRHQRRIEFADRIPHRSYRRGPTPDASVPKVSLIVPLATDDDVDAVWASIQRERFGDREVWLVGDDVATAPFARLAGRARVSSTFADAVRGAAGEYVAVADPRVRRPTGLLAMAVERLESDKRAAVFRVAYHDGGTRHLRVDSLEAADRRSGRFGLPLFALARRRDLVKDPDALGDPASVFPAVRARERHALAVTSAVETDGLIAHTETRLPGVGDLTAIGPTEAARVVRAAVRRSRPDPKPSPGDGDADGRIRITYVGYTGSGNMGDEAVLEATRRALPWARVDRALDAPDVVMLGGGTLVNGKGYYLTRVLREDRPEAEKAVFGAGVRDPAFHGTTERVADWWPFFEAAAVMGVRGPDSVAHLRTLGYRGNVEIIGDPALLLERPEGVERHPGRLVVCPVWTSGDLVGGDDTRVFDALAAVVRGAIADGRDVVLLSAFPHDDRHLFELMRTAGHPDLPFVAGYEDLDATMALLASAEVVVAERLHAAIMATAAGTPWLGLGYWPKTLDFAKSVDAADLVVDTAGVDADSLEAALDRVLADPAAVVERLAGPTADLRGRLRAAADRLHTYVDPG